MTTVKTLVSYLDKLKEIRLNRDIVTYLICVVIASILWFLNALNKDYSSEISYPVKYINFPEGKYPVSSLPSQIQLEVKAKGFALLGHQIRTSFLPITFNVGTYSSHLSPKNDLDEFILNTNDIKDKIGSQLSSDIKLQSVSPEEIKFKFAPTKNKKVAVRPNLDYSLKRQYILRKIVAVPDSVEVCGPAPVIDTLRYIPTEPIRLKNLDKNTARTAELAEIPECTVVKDRTVKVEIQVEQFTEAKKTIPITPLNVPDSLTLRLFPDNVDISYEIGLSQYDKVSSRDFIFAVEYPENMQETYLEIKVKKAPDYIKNLSIVPQKVEYILEKK